MNKETFLQKLQERAEQMKAQHAATLELEGEERLTPQERMLSRFAGSKDHFAELHEKIKAAREAARAKEAEKAEQPVEE
jgi:hypothetical protein